MVIAVVCSGDLVLVTVAYKVGIAIVPFIAVGII